MATSNLHEVLIDMLKDTYNAEKQLVAALPKMAKAANSEELRGAFESHLEETREHVARLEQAFSLLELKPTGKTCHAMKGLVEEGKEVIEEADDESPCTSDAALIAAAQKVEHYEIAAYGTMVAYAKAMGHDEVVSILQATLDEEKTADQSLTGIAEMCVESAIKEGDTSEHEMIKAKESKSRGGAPAMEERGDNGMAKPRGGKSKSNGSKAGSSSN